MYKICVQKKQSKKNEHTKSDNTQLWIKLGKIYVFVLKVNTYIVLSKKDFTGVTRIDTIELN